MNSAARQLAREAYRRLAAPQPALRVGRIGDMLATRFDKQLAFIGSPAKRKAALCTRRAGKTESVAAYLLKSAEEWPGCVVMFVAPTLGRARELMWKPLNAFNVRFGFDGKPNDTRLTLSMPNGAEIRLSGADKLKEAEKKRGDKLALVVVDEASVYPSEVLKGLVEDVFGPALEDVQGAICVMGTPGINCAGKWWEMTKNEASEREAGWEVFQWSVLDNPFMAHMRQRLPELKRERGWADDNPTYVREWLGRWVNDAGALFYRYSDLANGNPTKPTSRQWHHVMGVDLGHDDAFAIVVWAFSEESRHLYAVETFKASGLLPSDWTREITERVERLQPVATVVDSGGLGKAFVLEMQQRHGLPVEAAEKQSKAAFVELMNDDFTAGRIHLDKSGPYAAELRTLAKDADDPLKEDSRFANHLCDAGLYGWRAALHYLGVEPEELPPPGTAEAANREAQRMELEMEARVRARQQEAQYGFGRDDAW